jgi:hypothetical protein
MWGGGTSPSVFPRGGCSERGFSSMRLVSGVTADGLMMVGGFAWVGNHEPVVSDLVLAQLESTESNGVSSTLNHVVDYIDGDSAKCSKVANLILAQRGDYPDKSRLLLDTLKAQYKHSGNAKCLEQIQGAIQQDFNETLTSSADPLVPKTMWLSLYCFDFYESDTIFQVLKNYMDNDYAKCTKGANFLSNIIVYYSASDLNGVDSIREARDLLGKCLGYCQSQSQGEACATVFVAAINVDLKEADAEKNRKRSWGPLGDALSCYSTQLEIDKLTGKSQEMILNICKVHINEANDELKLATDAQDSERKKYANRAQAILMRVLAIWDCRKIESPDKNLA